MFSNISQVKIFNQITKTRVNFKIQAKVYTFLKVYLTHRIKDNRDKIFKSQFYKHLVVNTSNLINELVI
jgi:hypothetical protein